MGLALPQVVTQSKASGAQIIDGSLKFDDSANQHLERTISASNRRTFTLSAWVKHSTTDSNDRLLGNYTDSTTYSSFYFRDTPDFQISFVERISGTYNIQCHSTRMARDTGWYHIVWAVDTTQSTDTDRVKLYINGVQETITGSYSSGAPSGSVVFPSPNYDTRILAAYDLRVGARSGTDCWDGLMSQFYVIDGQALGPESFGYTDGLTNTWRPKKYEGLFGIVPGDYAISGGSNYLNREPADMFDGSTSTYWQAAASGDRYQLMTFATPKTGTTIELSVLASNGWDGFEINGSVPSSLPSVGSQSWFNITTHTSGSLSSIRIAYTSGVETQLVYALRIDGTIITGQTQTPSASNSFYLPMDGNSPIGEDKSGQGNNYTPVNFGGSVALPKATGARPILNTDGGGNVARPGVFGSELNQTIEVTVSNASGNNRYYFDGSLTPNLAFTRGSTITFHTTNNGNVSGDGHPFKLSSTNASGSAGTEYTDGVAYYINGSVVSGSDYVSNYSSGAASGFRGIKWTVPHNQSTTYYYCTIHTGMGNNGALTSTIDETKADPYAWKNVLALPLVGSANDVSNSVNSGSTTKTVTSTNAVASSASSNFYGGSWYFDGSGDYLTVPYAADTFSFGTGDFTIEAYVNMSAVQYTAIISSTSTSINATNHWLLGFSNTANMMSFKIDGSGNSSITSDFSGYYSKWTHVAVSRESGTIRLFFDGIEKASATDTSSLTGDSGNAVKIGQRYTNQDAYSIIGYMQDLRVYNGVAKYTSDFVVPATSPDILPDTPSGVSGGSKLAKVTDGAVSFDGTSDSLTFITSSDLSLDGDFTIEFYIYNNTIVTDIQHPSPITMPGTTVSQIYTQSTNDYYGLYRGGDIVTTGNNSALTGVWQHVAFTRSGSTCYAFLNGDLKNTATNSDTFGDATGTYRIGSYNGSGGDVNGFISNLRIIKGTALYTTYFTPPTRELTNVTNTKLLCCQSNNEGPQKTAVIPSTTGTAGGMWPVNSDINDDSGNNRTLTENGGSTTFVSAASNSFGITNAANFAKDGKYLSYAITPAAEWTIDGYIRLETATTSAPYILGWNGTNGNDTSFGFPSDGSLKFQVFGSFGVLDSGVVAEIGRWYHIRMTTNSTSDLKLFVDGVLVAQQTSSDGDPTSPITFGDVQSGRFSGQVAGVRYTPTDLGAPVLGGEVTSNGVTTNSPPVGVRLNGNVSATNFNPFNTDINTVRGQETGYPTWNPLNKTTTTFSNGNLQAKTSGGSGYPLDMTNTYTPAGTGKWYWEFELRALNGANETLLGMIPRDSLYIPDTSNLPTEKGGISVYVGVDGSVTAASGAATAGTATATFGIGDILGWAFDAENGTLKCFKNGVPQGTQFTNIRTDIGWVFCVTDYNNSAANTYVINFGQNPFHTPPPIGYQPLNAANIRPETVITRPDHYVGASIWTGNNTENRLIPLNMKPDLIWIKQRNDTRVHILQDSVRGFTKGLYSNATDAESTRDPGYGEAVPGGFEVSSGAGSNVSGRTMVAWNWKAGGNKNTFNVDDVGYASAAAAGLTGGSITPTGSSVGTKQGFSIIKYAGTDNGSAKTIPHGLSQKPDFMIVKQLTDNSTAWTIYHVSAGATKYLVLNTQGAAEPAAGPWNNTEPTSSVFSVGTGYNNVNRISRNFISYLWHDVPGLQKFGSFEANQNADGPFIELGFRPAIVWIKNIDNYDPPYDWVIYDNARSTINPNDKFLSANLDNQENSGSGGTETTRYVDFLSNGFKVRTASTSINLDQHTQVYCAWAEAPTFNLYGAQSNAR